MAVIPFRKLALRAAGAALLLAGAPAARSQGIALTFEQAVYADGADKDAKALKAPRGVACGETGGVVVADTGNGRLVRYALREGRLSGGTEIKLPQLTYPVSVELDSKGTILALDGKTRKLVRVAPNGTFQGVVEVRGASGTAVLPSSFAIDAADNLYVLDAATRRVLVLGPGGAMTRQVELPKEGVFTDVAVDASGTVYAVDAVGVAVWSAEKTAPAFKPLTKGMKDKMSFPSRILAKKGRLYLVDEHGMGIVVLGIDGSYQGRQLSLGWKEGFVYYPDQLCMTDAGQVFIADRDNNRVQYFTSVK